jgi:hypothetical protein
MNWIKIFLFVFFSVITKYILLNILLLSNEFFDKPKFYF